MNESKTINGPKVVVWHDAQATHHWMVAVVGPSGRIERETPYHDEADAIAIARTIGQSRGCPICRRTREGTEQPLQP